MLRLRRALLYSPVVPNWPTSKFSLSRLWRSTAFAKESKSVLEEGIVVTSPPNTSSVLEQTTATAKVVVVVGSLIHDCRSASDSVIVKDSRKQSVQENKANSTKVVVVTTKVSRGHSYPRDLLGGTAQSRRRLATSWSSATGCAFYEDQRDNRQPSDGAGSNTMATRSSMSSGRDSSQKEEEDFSHPQGSAAWSGSTGHPSGGISETKEEGPFSSVLQKGNAAIVRRKKNALATTTTTTTTTADSTTTTTADSTIAAGESDGVQGDWSDELTPAQQFYRENKAQLLRRAHEYYAEKQQFIQREHRSSEDPSRRHNHHDDDDGGGSVQEPTAVSQTHASAGDASHRDLDAAMEAQRDWFSTFYKHPVVRPPKRHLWDYGDIRQQIPKKEVELEKGTMPSIQQFVEILQQETISDVRVVDLEECGRRDVGVYAIIGTGVTSAHCKRVGKVVCKAVMSLEIPYVSASTYCWGAKGDEWIITHCGPVKIHLVVPHARQTFKLEELWLAPHEHMDAAEFPGYFDETPGMPPPYVLRSFKNTRVAPFPDRTHDLFQRNRQSLTEGDMAASGDSLWLQPHSVERLQGCSATLSSGLLPHSSQDTSSSCPPTQHPFSAVHGGGVSTVDERDLVTRIALPPAPPALLRSLADTNSQSGHTDDLSSTSRATMIVETAMDGTPVTLDTSAMYQEKEI